MKELVGTPLDYSNRNNWMVYNDDTDFAVDTLYFYPTSADPDCQAIICDVTDYMKGQAMYNYLKSGAGFTEFTNVYAPYYRQISVTGIMQDASPDGLMNTIRNNITRTDAFAALDYYFENINKGNPFFLVSHSQGSAVCKIVFEEYMKVHPEYMSRLIASYNIGFYFPDSWFEANQHIKKAAGETDTGCLITWEVEIPGCKEYNLPLGNNDGFCINPLNWKIDETPAPISANLGSVEVSEDNIQVAVPGKADAVINLKRGSLICTSELKPGDVLPANPLFGDGSIHTEEWALYYRNTIENAKKRMDAFLA